MNSNRRLKRQIRDHNHTICVSNATNSRSPDDLKSRIFIGNLNTSVITKRHLQLLFIQFGHIRAISMHKGYAFIQYEDQMDALNAVIAQDGQLIAGQAIDVNLVTEPKPHQKSNKVSTASPGSEMSGENTTEISSIENSESDINSVTNFDSNLNDMNVDCNEMNEKVFSQPEDCVNSCKECSALIESDEGQTKRKKLEINHNISICDVSERNSETSKDNNLDNISVNCLDKKTTNSSEELFNQKENPSFGSLLSNSSLNLLLTNQRLSQESLAISQVPNNLSSYDLLICGTCRHLFTSLNLFIQHKKTKCRLRFVCHCHQS